MEENVKRLALSKRPQLALFFRPVSDVNFREDDSRTRERILGNNLSWLRRFAITLLKRHPANDSLIGKMNSCMISTAFLTEVLALNQV